MQREGPRPPEGMERHSFCADALCVRYYLHPKGSACEIQSSRQETRRLLERIGSNN
jgi:hypothetical protein